MADVADELKRQFKLIDGQKSGKISKQRLGKIIKEIDVEGEFTDEMTGALIDFADKSKDGYIDYAEFVDFITFIEMFSKGPMEFALPQAHSGNIVWESCSVSSRDEHKAELKIGEDKVTMQLTLFGADYNLLEGKPQLKAQVKKEIAKLVGHAAGPKAPIDGVVVRLSAGEVSQGSVLAKIEITLDAENADSVIQSLKDHFKPEALVSRIAKVPDVGIFLTDDAHVAVTVNAKGTLPKANTASAQKKIAKHVPEAKIKAVEEAVMALPFLAMVRADSETNLKVKDEQARAKIEEDSKTRATEEARIKAEEEAAAKAAEQALEFSAAVRISAAMDITTLVTEQAREKAREEAKAGATVEARIKAENDAMAVAAEEARAKLEEDAKTKATEEARIKAEEEAAVAKAVEEARAKAIEEARIKGENEAAAAKAGEEARVKAEAEANAKALEEARITAEEAAAAKAAEEEKMSHEEDAKARGAEEIQIKAEEETKAKAAEEARVKTEEHARTKAAEKAKIKAEEEAATATAEVKRVKAREEAHGVAAEEARIKAETDAKATAVEATKVKIEEDVKNRAEKEARIKAEEEAAVAKAMEEARAKAVEEARIKGENEAAAAKAGEEARVKAEAEANAKALEEARITAEEVAAAKAVVEPTMNKEEYANARVAEEKKIRVEEETEAKAAEKARITAEETKVRAAILAEQESMQLPIQRSGSRSWPPDGKSRSSNNMTFATVVKVVKLPLSPKYQKAVQDFGYNMPDVCAEMLKKYVYEPWVPSYKILVAGAGDCLSGKALMVQGFEELTGIDMSPELVKMGSKSKIFKKLEVADLGVELKYPDAEFNGIVVVDEMAYLEPTDGALERMIRVVKPGGLILLTHRTDKWAEWRAKQEDLEKQGLWSLVEISEPRPYIKKIMVVIYIYRVGNKDTFCYLPRTLKGKTILEEMEDGKWKLTNETLKSETSRISFRKTKHMGDRLDGYSIAWESIIEPIDVLDVDDKWLTCQRPGTKNEEVKNDAGSRTQVDDQTGNYYCSQPLPGSSLQFCGPTLQCPSCTRHQAKCLRGAKQYQKVIEILTDEVCERSASGWFNRGFAEDELQKYEEAVSSLTKCIDIQPDFASGGARANRARCLKKLGRYTEALDDYNKKILQRPTSSGAFVNRAKLYELLNDTAKAREDYERAAELGDKEAPRMIQRLANTG